MIAVRGRFGVGVLLGLVTTLLSSPGYAASGLATIDAVAKVQAKGCGKLAGNPSAALALQDGGTWALTIDDDSFTGTYAAGGKGGRTLTLSLDANSLATLETGLRSQAATVCGTPVDSAVVTLKTARAKLNKTGTSVALLVKASLAGDGNPLKKGKYTLKGDGSLGPLPTTTTSTVTTTSTITTTSVATSTSTTVTFTTSTTSPPATSTSSSTSSTLTSTSTTVTFTTSTTNPTTTSTSSSTSSTLTSTSTTTSTTVLGTSTTVTTPSTTTSTSLAPGGYGDCVNGGAGACTGSETCLTGAFGGNTIGLCTLSCLNDAQCPPASSGNPTPSCDQDALACLLRCDGGETCPDGMTCIGGMFCVFTGPCTPSCTGICGDDGCGGSCGQCDAGSVCVGSECVAGDSCVGRCGTFDEQAACQCDQECLGAGDCCADICNPGACEGSEMCSCTPDCTERVCGSDGCFGTCGECLTPGDVCSAAGQCAAGNSCLGRCDTFDQAATCQCDGACVSRGDCCANICDTGVCDTAFVCTCVPNCSERVCGPDGCFGECGTCLTGGDVCTVAGQCASGSSCLGRCATFDNAASCNCDDQCVVFDDCCPDLCDQGVCDNLPMCAP